MLFSFSSIPPARPTSYKRSVFQVDARSVAQGNAVVATPQSGMMRTPAGPSSVMKFGMPAAGTFPKPQVLATPVLGCPPVRWISSSSERESIKASRLIRPSAASMSCGRPFPFHACASGTGAMAGCPGIHPSPNLPPKFWRSRTSASSGPSSVGSASKDPSESILSFKACGTALAVSCSVTVVLSSCQVKSAFSASLTFLPT